jgi:hypothetical protein
MAYFQNKKSQSGQILERLAMIDVGVFLANWYTLWPFVIFYDYLVFFPVLVCLNKKNLATLFVTYACHT